MKKLFTLLLALCSVALAPAKGKEDMRQRVLEASHSTRINDVDMKPWHLKVKFQLNQPNGKSEAGTIDEWWAGLALWKMRVESPSYTGTVIENRNGDFRTQGVSPVPLPIRAIEQQIVYPMPMGEDLSKTVPHVSHLKLERKTLDCIQLSESPIPAVSPTFCFDPGGGNLRAIISGRSRTTVRTTTGQLEGHLPALSITMKEGDVVIASAEVVDLSETPTDDSVFTPSPDMKKVLDAHMLKVVP